MQDDGKKAIEDDLIDDDMDFGDFDDDFDDDLDLDIDIDVSDEAGVDDWDENLDSGSPAGASSKDSFVKKNFNLIVIAVAVIGGGGFVLSQMGGAPAPAPIPFEPTADVGAEIVDVDMGDMPPAPASVDVGAPVVELSGLPMEENNIEPVDVAEDAALTPLPTLGGEHPDLVPLDFLSDDSVAASQDAADDFVSQLPPELPLNDVAQNEIEEFEADLEAVIDNPLAELDLDPVSEDVVEPIIDVEPAPEFTGLPALDTVSVPSAPIVDENADLIEVLREDNGAKDAAIVEANAQVSDLEGTVDALKAELESIKASLSEARAAEKRALENKAAVVTSSVPAKAVAVAPTKKPAVKVKWTLRAAQPGKAMIYNDATQDVLSVENGDVVPGIGTVKSISVREGLWVVQGTKGRITQ